MIESVTCLLCKILVTSTMIFINIFVIIVGHISALGSMSTYVNHLLWHSACNKLRNFEHSWYRADTSQKVITTVTHLNCKCVHSIGVKHFSEGLNAIFLWIYKSRESRSETNVFLRERSCHLLLFVQPSANICGPKEKHFWLIQRSDVVDVPFGVRMVMVLVSQI